MKLPSPFKFGVFPSPDNSSDEVFKYPDIWSRESTNGGGSRLVIAPAENHVDLLARFAEQMIAPFWILHVLLVPRDSTHIAGRYQSPQPETLESVKRFLADFKAFLEGDGRHHLWIGSASTSELLVYDKHNVIYAYGVPDTYLPILAASGLQEVKTVRFPTPHVHHYNEEFDADEARLLAYWEWRRTPLLDSDDL